MNFSIVQKIFHGESYLTFVMNEVDSLSERDFLSTEKLFVDI